MRYQSTRGGVKGLSFEDALLSGFASDGGLIVPEEVPKIPIETLKKWKEYSYTEVAKSVFQLLVDEVEISVEKQHEILEKSFATFSIPEVVRFEDLGEVKVAELWHGKSLAFKDLAMTCVANLTNYFLSKRNKHITALVLTSGDTGSSAIEAVRGLTNIDLIVMFPSKGLSEIQRKMMTTPKAENIHPYSIECTNDDLDLFSIEIFSDSRFCKHHHVSTLNSTNWGRVAIQIAHHVFIYLRTARQIGDVVDVVLPTGGAGNMASGWFAREMGIPVNFISTVNRNNLMERVIMKNEFKRDKIVNSLAPAMDIQLPLNFERVLWLSSDKNCDVTKDIMTQYQKIGEAKIPDDLHKKICKNVKSVSATDDEIVLAMKKCWIDNRYLACPHTSTGLAYLYGLTKNGNPGTLGTKTSDGLPVSTVCISTASPYKFKEAFDQAKIPLALPEEITIMLEKEEHYTSLVNGQNWVEMIKEKISDITIRANKLLQ